jgi:NUDIX domain
VFRTSSHGAAVSCHLIWELRREDAGVASTVRIGGCNPGVSSKSITLIRAICRSSLAGTDCRTARRLTGTSSVPSERWRSLRSPRTITLCWHGSTDPVRAAFSTSFRAATFIRERTSQDAAARELLEETGFAGNVSVVGSAWSASACRTERFVAMVDGATKVALPATDAEEFCEVVLMALEGFRTHLRSGQLTDVDLGYLALDHLGVLG